MGWFIEQAAASF